MLGSGSSYTPPQSSPYCTPFVATYGLGAPWHEGPAVAALDVVVDDVGDAVVESDVMDVAEDPVGDDTAVGLVLAGAVGEIELDVVTDPVGFEPVTVLDVLLELVLGAVVEQAGVTVCWLARLVTCVNS